MMAKELGVNVLLYVRPAGASGGYSVVKGQQDTQLTRARASIDTTDKSSDGWRTSLPGLKDIAVTATGQVDWSDVDGWQVIEGAYDGAGLVDVYLRQNKAGRGYVGTMAVMQCDATGGTETPTQYNVSLASSSALTVVEAATFDGDTAAPTTPEAPAMPYFDQPFQAASVWNIAIPGSAVYEPVAADLGALDVGFSTWLVPDTVSVPVYQASASDPLVAIKYNADNFGNLFSGAWKGTGNSGAVESAILAGSSATFPSPVNTFGSQSGASYVAPNDYDPTALTPPAVRLPAGARPSGNADGHMVVYQPDGSVLETYATVLLSDGTIVCSFYKITDPALSGDGWQNGATASLIPVYAGLIREAEVTAGSIDHAIKVVMPAGTLKPEFVYPALAFDRGALTENPPYSGDIPMGARLAVPASFDPESLGTSLGRIVGRAAKTHGFIVVDRGGSGITLIVEGDVSDPVLDNLNYGVEADLKAITAALQRVTVPASAYTPSSPNSAPTTISIAWGAGYEGGVIPADTDAGTVIGTLSTDDPEGDWIYYTEVADPDGKITVSGSDLVLAATVAPGGSHDFTIRARDVIGHTVEQEFTITGAAEAWTTLVDDGFEGGAPAAYWGTKTGAIDTAGKLDGANSWKTVGTQLLSKAGQSYTGILELTFSMFLPTGGANWDQARIDCFKTHPEYISIFLQRFSNEFEDVYRVSSNTEAAPNDSVYLSVAPNSRVDVTATIDVAGGTYSIYANNMLLKSGTHTMTSVAEILLGPTGWQAANFTIYWDSIRLRQQP